MATAWLNRLFRSSFRTAPHRRRPAGVRLRVEELEARVQPAAFFFSTGLPDGKAATNRSGRQFQRPVPHQPHL